MKNISKQILNFSIILTGILSANPEDYRLNNFRNEINSASCIAVISQTEVKFFRSKIVPATIQIPSGEKSHLNTLLIYSRKDDGTSMLEEFPVIDNRIAILPKKEDESVILVKLKPLEDSIFDQESLTTMDFVHVSIAEARALFESKKTKKQHN